MRLGSLLELEVFYRLPLGSNFPIREGQLCAGSCLFPVDRE